MPNYLKEAFKELELLNEETFSFDKDGAAELKKFYDGDTTDDYESIIDPEAETKDELEDSYEGKVIIACKICHGMQYKDPQDIVIDEESDYVNVGEECPACSSVDGYKIVGQVAPYCAECDEMDESASELKESTWNFNITRMPKVAASKLDKIESSGLWDDFLDEMDDNTESITVHTDEYRIVKGTSDEVIAHDKKIMWDLINKYYNKALKKSKGESLSESLNENRNTMLVIESLKNAPKKHFEESLNEEKLTTLFDVVGGMLDGTMDRITINKKTGKKQAVGTKTPYDAEEDIGVDDDGYFVWVADEAGAKYAQEVADKFGLKTKLDAPTKYIRDSKNRKFHIYIPESRYDEPVEQVVEESWDKLDEGIFNRKKKNKEPDWASMDLDNLPDGIDRWTAIQHGVTKKPKFRGYRINDQGTGWVGITESNMSELDKGVLIYDILSKLEQEGYDVRTHKRDAIAYADGAAELIMIAPDGYTVDKWFEDTKMNHPEDLLRFKKFSDLKESVENITVETDSDTIKVEPSEDGKVEVKTEPKEKDEKSDEEMIVPVSAETKDEIDMNDANFDETDVDIDIDSIDDEGFDALSESYLKKVYENVESFKTSSSSIKDGKLMVEGVISFNSGKKAKTSFVFESISKTKRGKIKFLGENLNFSKSKRAFTLIAKPEGKKAVCESLTYNYVAKDSKSNKKLPVYGKVSK